MHHSSTQQNAETIASDYSSSSLAAKAGQWRTGRVATMQEIRTLLLLAGIEPNPGPKSAKKKKAQAKRPPAPSKNSKPGVFTTLGKTIGGAIGGPIGRGISAVGSFLGKVTGLGDYKVKGNSLMTDNGPPLFSNSGYAFRIRHREYLQDVVGSTTFSSQTFTINPGLVGTFPWLSKVAVNFEVYRLRGLLFEFKTTSATAVSSTNTALGTVVMATQYNVQRDDFPDKKSAEAYEYCTSTVPCMSMLHPVECDPSQLSSVQDRLQVRSTALKAGDNALLYDHGKMQLMTVGMQAAATIGELWVTYDVEFFFPRLNTDSTNNTNKTLHLTTSPNQTGLAGTNTAAGLFFGTDSKYSSTLSNCIVYNNLGSVVTTTWDGTGGKLNVTVPLRGRYLAFLWLKNVNANGSTDVGLAPYYGWGVPSSNIATAAVFNANSTSGFNFASYVGTQFVVLQCFDVTADGTGLGNTLVYTNAQAFNANTTTVQAELVISAVPSNFTALRELTQGDILQQLAALTRAIGKVLPESEHKRGEYGVVDQESCGLSASSSSSSSSSSFRIPPPDVAEGGPAAYRSDVPSNPNFSTRHLLSEQPANRQQATSQEVAQPIQRLRDTVR